MLPSNKEKVSNISLKYYSLRMGYKCKNFLYWSVELFAKFFLNINPIFMALEPFYLTKENFLIINSILYSTSKISM